MDDGWDVLDQWQAALEGVDLGEAPAEGDAPGGQEEEQELEHAQQVHQRGAMESAMPPRLLQLCASRLHWRCGCSAAGCEATLTCMPSRVWYCKLITRDSRLSTGGLTVSKQVR